MILGLLSLAGVLDITDNETFWAVLGLAVWEAAAEALVMASLGRIA